MRTNTHAPAIAMALTLLAAAPCVDAAFIDTSSMDATACCYGESGAHYFGQTFVALDERISLFEFSVLNNPGGAYPGPANIRALLIEGGLSGLQNRAVLAEAGTFNVSNEGVVGPIYTTIAPDFSGVQLVTGQTYTWVLDFLSGGDGINDSNQIAMNIGANYSDGAAYFALASGQGRSADLAGPWYQMGPIDAAFRMEFAPVQVDEPGVLPLMLVGGLLLPVALRRRKAA